MMWMRTTVQQIAVAACTSLIAAAAAPGGKLFDCPNYSLQLQLPAGWEAFEADFSVMHYRDVFLCINSIGSPTLRVQGSGLRGGLPHALGAYNPEVVADQLQEGTVYIDFGFWGRPGSGQQFSSATRDNYAFAATGFPVDSLHSLWRTPRLTQYQFGFAKWGQRWSIWLYFREPVSTADRQAAFALLKNITFVDRPVTSCLPAAAAAFESLPQAFRDSVLSDASCIECCWGLPPRCESLGSDFIVTFDPDGTDRGRRWRYRVSRPGVVVLLPSGKE